MCPMDVISNVGQLFSSFHVVTPCHRDMRLLSALEMSSVVGFVSIRPLHCVTYALIDTEQGIVFSL